VGRVALVTLLLDTHTWFWTATRPEALSDAAADAIADVGNDLALSPVTIWELLVLARKRRLDLGADRHAWVRTHIVEGVPKTVLPLTAAIADRSERLPSYTNPDPADRFLAATALEHDLVLVTADRSLRDYGPLRTLW
jgi:PIN domain nuclease of toxin-antitoxin system